MGGLPMAIQIEANLSLRNTRCASKPRSICSTLVENPLQNHTFLCKTKPISEKAKLTQPLFNKQLTKIFVLFCTQKTKPIQSQTKPIQSQFTKCQKMNINSVKTKDYENELTGDVKKTKPIKPNSRKPKMPIKTGSKVAQQHRICREG
jgi:hypothetical protein